MTAAKSHRTLWYTRRDGVVRGPYPEKQISRYVLLGRIRESDELRPDDGVWEALSFYDELIPEVMKLPQTAENRQKLLMARMHEDERQPGDRRDRATGIPAEIEERRRGDERRRQESAEELRHRELKYEVSHVARNSGKQYRYPMAASGVVVAGLLLSYVLTQVEPEPVPPDCSAKPRPGVNWNHCNQIGLVANRADLIGANISNARLDTAQLSGAKLSGVNLEYTSLNLSDLKLADLSHANLVGVAMRGSDLRNSKLINANLSYANLSGARIEGADFSGAVLDHTIWIDQQPCAPGSVGVCKRYKE